MAGVGSMVVDSAVLPMLEGQEVAEGRAEAVTAEVVVPISVVSRRCGRSFPGKAKPADLRDAIAVRARQRRRGAA